MAGSIKGITVEIGGNTTKLGKALNDVNTKTRNLQRELKGVNTLLKYDPTNVILIKQKQDLLNTSIANTREKLDKDRFRRDLGGVEDAYTEVMRRAMEHK